MGEVWISKMICQVWIVLFTMWEYRNKALHIASGRVYKNEVAAINQAIRKEFMVGTFDLSIDLYSLFQDNVNSILGRPNQFKMQWLASI